MVQVAGRTRCAPRRKKNTRPGTVNRQKKIKQKGAVVLRSMKQDVEKIYRYQHNIL